MHSVYRGAVADAGTAERPIDVQRPHSARLMAAFQENLACTQPGYIAVEPALARRVSPVPSKGSAIAMTRLMILLACLIAAGCTDRSTITPPLSAQTPSPAATSGTGWTP